MTRMRLLVFSFVILTASVMIVAGIAGTHYTLTTGFLSPSAMASLVGGDRASCIGTFVGLGFGLLISAVVVAATAGGAAPAVLAIAGAYVPLATAAC